MLLQKWTNVVTEPLEEAQQKVNARNLNQCLASHSRRNEGCCSAVAV